MGHCSQCSYMRIESAPIWRAAPNIHTICWYSKGFPLITNGESQQRKSPPTFRANHKLAYRPVTIASTLLFSPDCGNGPRQTPDFFSLSPAPPRRLIGRKPRVRARPDSIKNESNRSITKKLSTKKYLISVFFAYATSFFSKTGKPAKQAKKCKPCRPNANAALHIFFKKIP